MNRIAIAGSIVAMACLALSCAVRSAPSATIEIQTEDVERFFRLYDAAGGRPTAEQLQRDYLDPGTAGLHHLARVRNVTGERIARTLGAEPELYRNARSCMAALPRIRERLEATFDKLLALYPEAQKPPVTILVGRGRPVAIAGPGDGVQIGLEAMCSAIATRFFDANVDDRFVRVIAHEYIHAQQAPTLANNERPSVLERSLVEGVAEFVGELISGGVSLVALSASATGRETEIETRFAADVDKTDLSDWVDNTTAESVGQLGYWVGYRIAKAFHQHAPDKRAAIREMIRMTDPRELLAKSGWYPGIALNSSPDILPTAFGAAVDRDVRAARDATEPFKVLDNAVGAGYERDVPRCVAHPSEGGMGFHHRKPALRGAHLDVEKPEILPYARMPDGHYKLTGVEYIVPFSAWSRSEAPVIMGQQLKRSDAIQGWYLHVWIWEQNPSGLFADWNPRVSCGAM